MYVCMVYVIWHVTTFLYLPVLVDLMSQCLRESDRAETELPSSLGETVTFVICIRKVHFLVLGWDTNDFD
jgi:ABC-type tungstate transport system substrate-binding protein